MRTYLVKVDRKSRVELLIESRSAEEARLRAERAAMGGDLDRDYQSEIGAEAGEANDRREADYVCPTPGQDEAVTQAMFPGWSAEHGMTRFGYRLPPNMSQLTDAEVRQWGRSAINTRADVEVAVASGQTDLKWVMDVLRWFSEVMKAVTKRLGEGDEEVNAYADDRFAEADAKIEEIKDELAAADCCVTLLGGQSYGPREGGKSDRWNGRSDLYEDPAERQDEDESGAVTR